MKPGDKVIIVDDVLATGGTMNAAIKLIQDNGGIVEKVLVVNIIQELKGLDKLTIPKEKVFYLYDLWLHSNSIINQITILSVNL